MRQTPLALLLALAVPASAAPGLAARPDLALEFETLNGVITGQRLKLKENPLFNRITQESGPRDPILTVQKARIDMIRKVEPSVVALARNGRTGCTGFFVDSQKELGRPSIIVTNAHCLSGLEPGAEMEIGLYSGHDGYPQMTAGKVLAVGDSEDNKDIGFLELNDQSLNRRPLPLWSKLDRGEEVVAIGHPVGITFTVTSGIVSAVNRDELNGMFVLEMNQSDAAINPGNSGGPLFNLWGSVVGINSAVISRSGLFAGIGMSLPSSYITLAMKQYKRTGNLTPGDLQMDVDPNAQSLIVSTVTSGGPADAAQLRIGDEILGVDDVNLGAMSVRSAGQALFAHMKYRSPGETIELKIRREGKEILLSATLGQKPAPPEIDIHQFLPFPFAPQQ